MSTYLDPAKRDLALSKFIRKAEAVNALEQVGITVKIVRRYLWLFLDGRRIGRIPTGKLGVERKLVRRWVPA